MGIPAFTVLKVARLRASRPQSPSADLTARLEAVEGVVQDLQQQLAETHERLDFAERLLGKAREEPRIGSLRQIHGLRRHDKRLKLAGFAPPPFRPGAGPPPP